MVSDFLICGLLQGSADLPCLHILLGHLRVPFACVYPQSQLLACCAKRLPEGAVLGPAGSTARSRSDLSPLPCCRRQAPSLRQLCA